MRCAEKQLLPVPVINRALKLDPSTDLRKEPFSGMDGVRRGLEADQEDQIAKLTGAEGKRVAMCREKKWLESVKDQMDARFGPAIFALVFAARGHRRHLRILKL